MKRIILSLFLITLVVLSFGQTTVTYDFSVAGAMTADNIDANLSFTTQKNSSSTNPAIFSGQIRLYQNATKGGSIIITPSNGAIITSLVVNASNRTGDAGYIVNGGTATNLTGGSSYSMTGLNANTSVEFFQRESGSSNRIYVDNFIVTYTLPAAGPTITVGSTSMTGFTYEVGAAVSPVQSNTIEWADLTGNVSSLNTVNSFEFSIDNGTSWNPASILNVPIPPFPATSLTATTVSVRLIAGLAVGNYLDTVVLYSLNADTVEIFLNGEVTAPVVPCSELFISEYVESGNEKYIEIYNPSASAISLSNYDVVVYSNTNNSPNTAIGLGSGSLASGATIVIKGGSSVATADISSNNLNFNGNDAVALRLSGTNIDLLGVIGSGNNYGESKTLTRQTTVDNPNDTYTLAEWVETTPFTVTGLGAHSSDCIVISCAISSITTGAQTACVPATNTYTQEVIVTYSSEPATGTLDVNGQSFAITTSPQTVTLVGLVSNGNSVDVSASFSDLAVCNATELALFTAPSNCTPSCSELFISEYVEGSSNNKYIEIHNPTTNPIDLSIYSIAIYSSGNSPASSTTALPSVNLAGGATYVIAHSSASVYTGTADFTTSGLSYNGNDPVALRKNGVDIDIVGTLGSSSNFAQNTTLARNASVQNPSTSYTVANWTSATSNTVSGLGGHTSDCLDFIWTGATDTDWSTASNWSSNVVPNSGSVVTIPDVSGTSGNFPLITPSLALGDIEIDANASLTVATGIVLSGSFDNMGTVTLQNGAYLDDFTNVGAVYNGDITIETLAANGVVDDQRFISSPVSSPMISEIADDLSGPWGLGVVGVDGVAVTVDDCNIPTLTPTSNYGNLFEYNETLITNAAQCELEGWVVRSSGQLEDARGYSAYLSSGSTFDFSGVPNTGAIQISATNTGSAHLIAEGWNLLGNPYPSPISRNAVIAAGALDVQYFVTSGVYQGSYAQYYPGENIAIGQGFQAKVNATANITFDNTMRNTNVANWYSNENWFEYKLEVSVFGANYADKTTLFYNNDATNSYEPMFDVQKRKSNAGHPTLSTTGANKDLALNGLSVDDLGETVPMNLESGANGTFRLSFEGAATFPVNTTIYLKDLQENIVHNIADGDYTFTANTTDNTERFEIIFIPEVTLETTKVDCEGNAGNVKVLNTTFAADRTFEILANNTIIATNDLVSLNEDLTAGAYVINVNDEYGGTQIYDVEIETAELIEATFTVSSNELFVGEMLLLNNTTTNSNNVDWSIDNTAITNVNNATYSFAEAGIYDVVMNVSNDECSDTKTETITVVNKTTGIETVSGEIITLYPNPANDVLYINSNEEFNIAIVDVLGKTVINTSENTIKLENLTIGMYIIQVYDTNNKLIGTEKLIKK